MEGKDEATNAAKCFYMLPANLLPPKPQVMGCKFGNQLENVEKSLSRYKIATGIAKQSVLVCVSTLLSVIGEDATKVFNTFQLNEGENEEDPQSVIAKFNQYCEPQTQVIYERYEQN